MKFENEINDHLQKIDELNEQIKRLKDNFEETINEFLPLEINIKILNYEVLQLENEIMLHNFCIELIKENKHMDLAKSALFTNAKKKKLNKLAIKYEYTG